MRDSEDGRCESRAKSGPTQPGSGALLRAAACRVISDPRRRHVGTSVGGLGAVTQLLQTLPLETGMGFVVVQHL